MTRCSYIPPEGLSVIAIAKERGGTTNGDIQALVDRFGCRAEATRIIGRAGSTVIDAHACDDHVGHLLGDAPCAWVEPVGSEPPPGWDEAPDVEVTIERTEGIAREGFGSPMLLAPPAWTPSTPLEIGQTVAASGETYRCEGAGSREAMAGLCTCAAAGTCAGCRRRVVDLGDNPTRERLEAAGFSADSASYREAAGLFDPAAETRERIECDRLLYGTGFGRLRPDGTLEHIPAPEMIVDYMPTPRSGWGESVLQRAQRTATCDVAHGIHVLGTDAASAATCQCGRPFKAAFERPADRPTDENTTCPATFGGSMHTYTPGAERCFCGKHMPPPYAVGDEVEWRTGPLDDRWHTGCVTAIWNPDVGDIDPSKISDELRERLTRARAEPFWIVRVDTAGERRFSGPNVTACLRRATT